MSSVCQIESLTVSATKAAQASKKYSQAALHSLQTPAHTLKSATSSCRREKELQHTHTYKPVETITMAISGSKNRTHPAVVTVKPSAPLEILQVPTSEPVGNEVKIVGQWTASTPLDMHQALGHFAVEPPQILGDTVAGTVIAVGPEVKNFKIGDEVFGFVWKEAKQKAHQLFCVAPENHFALVPKDLGVDMPAAVTMPDNFVTAWHTMTAHFGFELPWPRPQGYVPAEEKKGEWTLIWGGGSSVALYTLQILKWYGYTNIAVVSSSKHEKRLKQYGAKVMFDYRNDDVVAQINSYQDQCPNTEIKGFKYILDCIGSVAGSVVPVSQFARPSSKVAILLPTIIRDAAVGVIPEYSFDVHQGISWSKGVDASGVKTFFYMENAFLAEKLQNEIMPTALRLGIVEPNEKIIVEGETMVERAQKAINMLRDKKASGQRLVWRLANDSDLHGILSK